MYAYTFTCITPLAKNIIDADGEEQLIILKNNAYYKSTYYLEDIRGVYEIFKSNGEINKTRCCIVHNTKGDITVYGSADKIRNIVFNRNNGIDKKRKIGYGSN